MAERSDDGESAGEGQDPERTCAGCRAIDAREALFRLAVIESDQGVEIVPDLGRKLHGRGVSVHPRRRCVEQAVRRGGFSKALRRDMRADFSGLLVTMRAQTMRRAEGLLACLRRRLLALGTDAVLDALRAGAALLILVASDAAGRRDDLLEESRKRQVPALELSDKAGLGRLTGRATLGVLAILDVQMAREISVSARWLAELSEDG